MENLKLSFHKVAAVAYGVWSFTRVYFTKTLIIPDLTKTESSNVVLLYMYIFWRK